MIRCMARGIIEHDEDDEYADDAEDLRYINLPRMRGMVPHHPGDV